MKEKISVTIELDHDDDLSYVEFERDALFNRHKYKTFADNLYDEVFRSTIKHGLHCDMCEDGTCHCRAVEQTYELIWKKCYELLND